MILDFGKFAGTDISQVPTSYLKWLSDANAKLGAALTIELLVRNELPASDPRETAPVNKEMPWGQFKGLSMDMLPQDYLDEMVDALVPDSLLLESLMDEQYRRMAEPKPKKAKKQKRK